MGANHFNPQMLDMKHTLGPWNADEANARLIAAAPELLEALEMLITIEPNYFSADAYERSLWQNAREAIAKATGKK